LRLSGGHHPANFRYQIQDEGLRGWLAGLRVMVAHSRETMRLREGGCEISCHARKQA